MTFPNSEQLQAISAVVAWYARPSGMRPPVFILEGPAGSGKTSIIIEAVKKLGKLKVVYCALTGKAAARLQQKGCLGAMTLHRALLFPVKAAVMNAAGDKQPTDAKGELLTRLAFGSRLNGFGHDHPLMGANLVVVDESSMVGELIGRELLRWGIPVLAVGDRAQLPPVKSVDDEVLKA